jgi:hypothetical protein
VWIRLLFNGSAFKTEPGGLQVANEAPGVGVLLNE